jgi:hypothetical protein
MAKKHDVPAATLKNLVSNAEQLLNQAKDAAETQKQLVTATNAALNAAKGLAAPKEQTTQTAAPAHHTAGRTPRVAKASAEPVAAESVSVQPAPAGLSVEKPAYPKDDGKTPRH